MSEQPLVVSADESPDWSDVVSRAEHGSTVAVIAHGEHVADVVPSGELDRLRENGERRASRGGARRSGGSWR